MSEIITETPVLFTEAPVLEEQALLDNDHAEPVPIIDRVFPVLYTPEELQKRSTHCIEVPARQNKPLSSKILGAAVASLIVAGVYRRILAQNDGRA